MTVTSRYVDEELENEEEYPPQLPEYARIRERGVQAGRHITAILYLINWLKA